MNKPEQTKVRINVKRITLISYVPQGKRTEKCQGDTTNKILITNILTRTNVEKITMIFFECSNVRRNVDSREDKTNTDEHTVARNVLA